MKLHKCRHTRRGKDDSLDFSTLPAFQQPDKNIEKELIKESEREKTQRLQACLDGQLGELHDIGVTPLQIFEWCGCPVKIEGLSEEELEKAQKEWAILHK